MRKLLLAAVFSLAAFPAFAGAIVPFPHFCGSPEELKAYRPFFFEKKVNAIASGHSGDAKIPLKIVALDDGRWMATIEVKPGLVCVVVEGFDIKTEKFIGASQGS